MAPYFEVSVDMGLRSFILTILLLGAVALITMVLVRLFPGLAWKSPWMM